MSTENLAPLAASLAKAQAQFPDIKRTQTVEVKTKTGGSYTFKYAPLDTILSAVRGPLSANGLAISQLLDGTDLLTILLHESGATLEGRCGIPQDGNLQQVGSAITYLRRYSIQAILGIASEDDDDGNAAAGNRATRRDDAATKLATTVLTADSRPPGFAIESAFDSGLVGIAAVGKGDADFELRQTPTGWRIAFTLVEGRTKVKVIAIGALAEMVAEYRSGIEGQRVTLWGSVDDETFTPAGSKKSVVYQVVNLTRLKVGALDLSAPEPDDEDAVVKELGELAFGEDYPIPVPAA